MPNIVILGSLERGDYNVTYPIRNHLYNTEEGYQLAVKRFYPAIDIADVVLVWGQPGHHTQRDINYAVSKDKHIIRLDRVESLEGEVERLREDAIDDRNLIKRFGDMADMQLQRAKVAEARIRRVKDWIMSHDPFGLHPEYNELLKILGGEVMSPDEVTLWKYGALKKGGEE